MKKIADWLENHSFVRILDSLAKIGIIVAVASWVVELTDRSEARELTKRLAVYQAHEVLALSHFRNSTAAGMALEDLIKAKQDLAGMDLTEIIVNNVNLSKGNFSEVDFGESRFKNVNLSYVNLTNAGLIGVTFVNVDMKDAVLDGAFFEGSDLREVNNLTNEQLNKAIICRNTKLLKSLSINKYGISKDQSNRWLEKYNNSDYINRVIARCGATDA